MAVSTDLRPERTFWVCEGLMRLLDGGFAQGSQDPKFLKREMPERPCSGLAFGTEPIPMFLEHPFYKYLCTKHCAIVKISDPESQRLQ